MSTMRKLILLRHAKAEPPGSGRDHDRVLTDGGREAARQAGDWLAAGGYRPDLVLCSTAARTRGTWDEVETVLGDDIGVMFEDRLYDAEAEAVLGVISETGADVRELMIVGHNPSLEIVLSALVGATQTDALPTAGIRVLAFEGGGWSDLVGRGRIVASFQPDGSGRA